MTSGRRAMLAIWFALSATLLFAVVGDGTWMHRVPERDRMRPNPFAGNTSAISGGEKLFHQNCASCHGNDATGRDKHPALRSDRVRAATPGELYWLLTNGSMGH